MKKNKKWMIWIGIFLGILITVFIIRLIYLASLSNEPNLENVGLKHEQLKVCPSSQNCVSSEANTPQSHRIEPLLIKNQPDWELFIATLTEAGGTIQKQTETYVWATFTTPFIPFIDDVEARLDTRHHIIHLKSASRQGYSDLGVNARRIASLKRRFEQQKNR